MVCYFLPVLDILGVALLDERFIVKLAQDLCAQEEDKGFASYSFCHFGQSRRKEMVKFLMVKGF